MSNTTSRSRSAKSKRLTTGRGPKSHGVSSETYVFECTRQGCGYRIVREEKAEVGQARFDLKCPKCHNNEFKCLGKGDLPESLELTIPTPTIDFESIRPVDLGSN
jgi:Zn finger protein HypA/HybF involved in hydrogenase expression